MITISLTALMLLLSVFSMNFQPQARTNVALTPCHQAQTYGCGGSSAKTSVAKYLSLTGVTSCAQAQVLSWAIVVLIAVLASLIWADPLFKPPKRIYG